MKITIEGDPKEIATLINEMFFEEECDCECADEVTVKKEILSEIKEALFQKEA